jgi:HD-GYP domain-containing protein (c-di-GMP phosphodiesterase class II)
VINVISVNLSKKEDEEYIINVLSKKFKVNKSMSDDIRNINLVICDLNKLEEVNHNIKKIRRVSEFYIPIILVIVINNTKHKKHFSVKEVDYIIEINVEEEEIIDVVEKALGARKIFEDAHSKHESLLLKKKLGIFVQDSSGIILVNEKMKELVPDIIHCKFVHEAFSSNDRKELMKYMNIVAKGPKDIYEDYIEVFLEKEKRWLLIYAANTIFKNIFAIKGLAFEITESKIMKKQLSKAIKDIKTAYENSINLINSIVERKDPYTASHQRKVRELALKIAEELNLNVEKTEVIDKASILHDIGKIFIPSEILNKPGKLTSFEMKMIKQHPEHSYQLIMEANLNTHMASVVLQHHERLDGSGYPQGLTGDRIYYEAKILAVADVVEAMSSHRLYRPALGLEVALKEIQQNASRLYDQDVVNACVRVFEKGFGFSE